MVGPWVFSRQPWRQMAYRSARSRVISRAGSRRFIASQTHPHEPRRGDTSAGRGGSALVTGREPIHAPGGSFGAAKPSKAGAPKARLSARHLAAPSRVASSFMKAGIAARSHARPRRNWPWPARPASAAPCAPDDPFISGLLRPDCRIVSKLQCSRGFIKTIVLFSKGRAAGTSGRQERNRGKFGAVMSRRSPVAISRRRCGTPDRAAVCWCRSRSSTSSRRRHACRQRAHSVAQIGQPVMSTVSSVAISSLIMFKRHRTPRQPSPASFFACYLVGRTRKQCSRFSRHHDYAAYRWLCTARQPAFFYERSHCHGIHRLANQSISNASRIP